MKAFASKIVAVLLLAAALAGCAATGNQESAMQWMVGQDTEAASD
jgi:ABC-type glycerol-3-phosphate transport system substrate-binding protein